MAANQLENMQKQVASASAEKQAVFRLGQLDMRESIAVMLQAAADDTYGMTGLVLLIAADMVRALEV